MKARRTARLQLRPCAVDDLDALWTLWTAPDVRRYLWDNQEITREAAATALASTLEFTAATDLGLWLLYLPDSVDPIGFAGFYRGAPTEVELIYGLAASAWGQGYATEAVREALRVAFEEHPVERITATVDAPNHASRRVLERTSFTPGPKSDADPAHVLRFVLTREVYEHTNHSPAAP